MINLIIDGSIHFKLTKENQVAPSRTRLYKNQDPFWALDILARATYIFVFGISKWVNHG